MDVLGEDVSTVGGGGKRASSSSRAIEIFPFWKSLDGMLLPVLYQAFTLPKQSYS